jgi:hypothetical protein
LRSQAQVVCSEVSGRATGCASDFTALQGRLDGGGNMSGHLILEGEHIFQRTIKAVGPQMHTGLRFNQLGGDAHTPATLAH